MNLGRQVADRQLGLSPAPVPTWSHFRQQPDHSHSIVPGGFDVMS